MLRRYVVSRSGALFLGGCCCWWGFNVVRQPCLITRQQNHSRNLQTVEAAYTATIKGEQTSPSNSPSPVVAQLGTTNHILSFSCVSLRASVTSCGFMAIVSMMLAAFLYQNRKRVAVPPGISCLFANTSSKDSFISLSLMIRCNSCLASSIRALSEESITKISP